MKKSGLQFKNPKMERIIFEVNSDYIDEEMAEIQMNSEVRISKAENAREAVITLRLQIGQEGAASPFRADITVSSDFRWEKEVVFDLDKTLKISGSTMLLSYVRPLVANLTVQAGLPPFHIPFVDLTGE